ncbi:MAG TPA: SDR family NAD(P)-dependent oxidoreductase, partial [Chloroflexota bacterium]|nr:SDR family NAD(P)-dependent oxidoreductase [Chloroflexota bacterium]
MAVLDTFRLDGQVALVTGGSRGLGLQIAEALGEAGASVAITARRPDGLAQATQHLQAQDISAFAVACDISKNPEVEAAVQQVLQHYGHI